MARALNEAEKFYIDSHPKLTVSELSKVLGRPMTSVKLYLESKQSQPAEESELEAVKRELQALKEQVNPQKQTTPPALYESITDAMTSKDDKGISRATVMTEGASQIGDETRKTRGSRIVQNCVAKAKPNKK